MRLAIAQINPSVGAIDDNLTLILSHIEQAKKSRCELIVFPELSVCGYSPLDLLWQEGFAEKIQNAQDKIRLASLEIGVIVGGISTGTRQSNKGACSIASIHNDRKTELFNSALFFSGGSLIAEIPKASLSTCDVCNERRYFTPGPGTEVVNFNGRAIGVNLGADLYSKDGPTDVQASLGAEWIINISASPFFFGKQDWITRAASQQAQENRVTVFHVNLVGGQDQVILDGGSFVVGANGKLLYQAPCFAEGTFIIETDELAPVAPRKDDWISYARQAIVLGISDYLRKNAFSRVIIGISGGIDSALVAALAVEALGSNAVSGVYLPSDINSPQSRDHAHLLAHNLGIKIIDVPISQAVATCHQSLQQQISGLAAENMQARIRAVLLMALANQSNCLVLTTGNKSEIAVGYNTLYGDTIGALAPIGDLYKTQIWQMAEAMDNVIPRQITEKQPSAELRPNQTDQDDLPAYPVLDALLDDLIERNASRKQLLAHGFSKEVVNEVVSRYYKSEYKRRQLPPTIKLSATPMGIGRLIPITHQYEG
jgi:NAD+ synthase (glutamine-hydrolysing)